MSTGFCVFLDTPGEFDGTISVEFSTPIVLKGKWEVALVNLKTELTAIDSGVTRIGSIVALADFVENTYVRDKQKRFLGFYTEYPSHDCPAVYVPVSKKTISSINITLCNYPDLHTLHTQKTPVACTLHFRKV
jgi:hypothetical protein